jgi:hypothetical protein
MYKRLISRNDSRPHSDADNEMPMLDEKNLGSESMRHTFRSPLPQLRIGSELTTRKGVVFKVCEAVVLVANNGGESHTVRIERTRDGQVAEFVMTVGALANMTRGAALRRGRGAVIDWARTVRRRHNASGTWSIYRPLALAGGQIGAERPSDKLGP